MSFRKGTAEETQVLRRLRDLLKCRACELLADEVRYLRERNTLLLDQILVMANRPDATRDVVATEPDLPPKTVQDQEDEEEAQRVRIDAIAEAELRRYAERANVPLEAFRD